MKLKRAIVLFAVLVFVAPPAAARQLDKQECYGFSGYIEVVAQSRDQGLTQAQNLFILMENMFRVASGDPAKQHLRHYLQDEEDALRLIQSVLDVHATDTPPQKLKADFIRECVARAGPQS